MNIAICDDEQRDLEELLSALKEYDSSGKFEIYSFTAAHELFENSAKIDYDIVILDIEMSAPNGYEIALRLIEKEPKPLIIFLTKSMDYTIRGYGVAFRYLTKPISEPQLYGALDAAVRETAANRFTFSTDGASYIVRMDDIYFFEMFNHRTILHTADSEYTFRATLKDILSKLPSGYFGMPHKSYIVNFVHIKTACFGEIRLTNGVTIPVSRRRRKEFERMFHLYLGR